MEQQRSLNMQLPRGWYQVAGSVPHTFRRHGLSTQSGKLQLSLLPPEEVYAELDCESAQTLLRETLARQDIAVGTPLSSGCEPCAAGQMAFAVYKHVGGQHEYWVIPCPEATVFAAWEQGAKATAGMERHDIHVMLKELFFEDANSEEAASTEG